MATEVEKLLARLQRRLKSKKERVARVIYEKIIEYASLTDHTLEDLRDMGYPYKKNAPQNIHVPPYLVHTQSGKLVEAVRIEQTEKGWVIGIDESIAEHAKFVIFGTERMVSRDFITAAFNDSMPKIREILNDESD